MPRQPELFPRGAGRRRPPRRRAPLAERMRPRTLDEFVGQRHLLGPGRLLARSARQRASRVADPLGAPGHRQDHARASARARPAGTRAVALLRRAARREGAPRRSSTRPRTSCAAAAARRSSSSTRSTASTRRSRTRSCPHVERGTIMLIGATTENPSFEVIAPLLSRTRVLVLEPLDRRRRRHAARPRARRHASAASARRARRSRPTRARSSLERAQGDARLALGTLEVAARVARPAGRARSTWRCVEEAAQQKALLYDKGGEEHYNVISAFIKSHARQRSRRRGLLADAHARGRRGSALRRAAHGDLRRRGRRQRRPAGAARSPSPPRTPCTSSACPRAAFRWRRPRPISRPPQVERVATRAMLAAAAEVRAERRPARPARTSATRPTPLMKGLGYGRGYEYPHDHPDARRRRSSTCPTRSRGRRVLRAHRPRGTSAAIGERLRDSPAPGRPSHAADLPHSPPGAQRARSGPQRFACSGKGIRQFPAQT